MMGLEGEGIPRRERRAILRRAFIDSVPVLMGYTTMGFVAGVLLAAKGDVVLAPLWAFLSSALWVTGTMSIAGVGEIAQRASWAAFALMTLAVNFRYAFYGFTMLTRWKDVPLARKAYLVLMLTDENYALEAACPLKDPKRNLYYCTALSVLNHSYWVVGLTVGGVLDGGAFHRDLHGPDARPLRPLTLPQRGRGASGVRAGRRILRVGRFIFGKIMV